MLSVTWSVSHQLGYPALSAARVIAARSHFWSNSKSCPESQRRYGNSSLNATMWFGFGRRKKLALRRTRFHPFAERAYFLHKIFDFLKTPMNRRVTQVRDLIDVAQLGEHLRPDLP